MNSNYLRPVWMKSFKPKRQQSAFLSPLKHSVSQHSSPTLQRPEHDSSFCSFLFRQKRNGKFKTSKKFSEKCLEGWWKIHIIWQSSPPAEGERDQLFHQFCFAQAMKYFSKTLPSTQDGIFLSVRSFLRSKEKQLEIRCRERFDPFCWRTHFVHFRFAGLNSVPKKEGSQSTSAAEKEDSFINYHHPSVARTEKH